MAARRGVIAALKKAGLKPVVVPDGDSVSLASGDAGEDLP